VSDSRGNDAARDALRRLEEFSRILDPPQQQRADLADRAWRFVDRHLESLTVGRTYLGQSVDPSIDDDLDVTGSPVTIDEALGVLDRHILSSGVSPSSGGAFGYIPGGGLFPAALGDLIADVTNRYSGVYFASPGAVLMERRLVRWMCDLVGLPPGAGGDLTSGGSIANLSALVTARDSQALRGRDVERTVVYLTDQTHHCVDKSLRIAGMGECVVRRVPVDARWRMDAAGLERLVAEDKAAGLRPWMVVSSAGTTDTGAVDPLADVAEVADREGLWNHVDAAYGGFFMLTDTGRRALSGIEAADSVVMDPHKGLFLPFGSGALLVRDEQALAAAHSHTANYMQDTRVGDSLVSPADLGPELTRPFRGLRLWLPLKLFGLEPFRAALDEKLLLARYFHERVGRIPGFEVGPGPELSIVTYRYLPESGDADAFNRKLLQAVLDDGRVFISSTLLDGRFTLRFAALHFRSHLDETDYLLDLLGRAARELAGE
jgi:glutamate/tyrosine decarboxylase-like PLP-dependent enzyme